MLTECSFFWWTVPLREHMLTDNLFPFCVPGCGRVNQQTMKSAVTVGNRRKMCRQCLLMWWELTTWDALTEHTLFAFVNIWSRPYSVHTHCLPSKWFIEQLAPHLAFSFGWHHESLRFFNLTPIFLLLFMMQSIPMCFICIEYPVLVGCHFLKAKRVTTAV